MSGHVSETNRVSRNKIFLGVITLMNLNIKGMHDVMMFGRVLSAGLVVAGYAFLGVWVSQWLAEKGVNTLASLCAVPVITAFGMWQGWLFLTKGRKNPSSLEDQRDKLPS